MILAITYHLFLINILNHRCDILNPLLFLLFPGECPGIPVRTRDGRVPDDGKPQSNVHRHFIRVLPLLPLKGSFLGRCGSWRIWEEVLISRRHTSVLINVAIHLYYRPGCCQAAFGLICPSLLLIISLHDKNYRRKLTRFLYYFILEKCLT